MKSKFKLVTAIFVITILSSGLTTLAEEKTREEHKAWSTSSVETLDISNKFGEVKVNNNGGDSITIDVVITVEAPNEKNANELLESIEVNFSKSGSTAKAVTTLDNNFKSRQKFSIDYTVNIPSDKNLTIANKYGNTVVNKLTGSGDFNIQYGNLTANTLNASEGKKLNIYLAYGKSNIESISNVTVEVKYSTMEFSELSNLKLNSKYSVINLEEAGSVEADSKYDTFNFEEVQSVSATSKYSHFKIEELKKDLKIEAGYGSIKVEEVGADFESISIENSYGQIKLGLDDKSYSLDANCRYCGVSFPNDKFSGDRMKDNNTTTVKGKVGSASGGKVYIRSQYGEIKLQ